MKRVLTAGLIPALLLSLTLPVSSFFWKKSGAAAVSDLSKNGLIGGVIVFEPEDFAVTGEKKAALNAVVVESLPDAGAGSLLLGGTLLEVGSRVDKSALSGLRFQSLGNPTVTKTSFALRPVFANGEEGEAFQVEITLLTKENHPPVARNMDLSTYKNVSVTGYFDAVDAEGDVLTFRMMSNPARGAVELAEDGSGQFVYRPYENKVGKDTFTYVAVDEAGNLSEKATVTVRIEKGLTSVTYAELDGHPAHKSAVRLAENGIYVGAKVGREYTFIPDAPVSRAEFLAMAMAVAGLEPMEDVTVTGFMDDESIPAWSKGSVSAALKAGAIRGGVDERGASVFRAGDTVTCAQAAVMLDRLLNVTDVPMEVFSADTRSHWAGQAAADLAACGVLRTEDTVCAALEEPLTLGEAAILLDGAMDIRANR